MNVGDKVIFKGEDPRLSKGAIGHITHVDWLNDTITVRFDQTVLYCNPDEFREFMELVIEVKIDCPAVLKKWYKACSKYIGRRDD